jgi:hypothetical protein
MPPLKTVADIAFPILARAVASAKLSAPEGEAISRIFEGRQRAIADEDFEQRLLA